MVFQARIWPAVMFLCLVSPAGGGAGEQRTTVLIMDFHTEGIGGKAALQITSAVVSAFSGRSNYSVLTMTDVKNDLTQAESRQLVECREDTRCYLRFDKLKEIDLLVSGTAGMVGSKMTITISLIEGRTAVSRNRVSAMVDNTKALQGMVKGLVARLFDWSDAVKAKRFNLPGDSRKSFAVLDLVASGMDKSVAANLTQILSAEIKRIQGAKVISRDDIKAMLMFAEDKIMLGCADDSSCVAEVGAALGVEYMITGHVGKIGGAYIVSLTMISPADFKVVNRVSESFVGLEEQLVGAVRHAGRELIGLGGSSRGTLVLSTNAGEGTVFVDGHAVADDGAPIAGLSAGRHNLRIVLDDFFEWQSDIYVHPGGETSLAVDLDPRPAEWYQSWVFWTLVSGVAIIGAGVGVGLALTDTGGPQRYPFGLEVGLPER
jgi:TolB-like protein